MSLTPSNMLPLGSKATNFTLLDVVSGKKLSLEDLKGERATVIMFICNHCPFVKHIKAEVIALAKAYQEKKVSFIAISSNDVSRYPDDAPEKMREEAIKYAYPFPYLYDETQQIARSYQAACTPDFYLFDENLACIYRGQFDSARPGNNLPVTGEDLRHALERHLNGEEPLSNQKPSQGCNIKWINNNS